MLMGVVLSHLDVQFCGHCSAADVQKGVRTPPANSQQ